MGAGAGWQIVTPPKTCTHGTGLTGFQCHMFATDYLIILIFFLIFSYFLLSIILYKSLISRYVSHGVTHILILEQQRHAAITDDYNYNNNDWTWKWR